MYRSISTSRLIGLSSFLLGTTTLALGLSAPALAQSSGQPEVVTVTAERREENILDVPYNITAVSGERIDLLQVHDNAELVRSIPGVNIVDRGERNGSVVNGIRIRGLNVDSSALGDYSVSSAATVSTYVNDTPIFANFALKDIDRVEVLKGPQGTLYGSGALGGTVRYIMRQPEFDAFSGSASVTATQVHNSDNIGWAEDAVLNIPLAQTLALRVSGSRFDYPGLTDYVNIYKRGADHIPVLPADGIFSPDAVLTRRKDADDFSGWYGRAALRFKPSENFDATLTYMHESDDYGGRRAQALGVDGFGRAYRDNESGAMLLEPGSRDVDLLSLEANVDLGFATLTSSTSWYDHHGELTSDNTGFYAQNGWLFNFYYNYPRPLAEADRTYGDKAWIEEVRLVSNSTGPWQYVVGIFYEDQKQFGTQDSFLRGFKNWATAAGFGDAIVSDQDYLYRRNEEYKELAGYGELTFHVNDRLSFTGGFRAFQDQSDAHVFQITGLYTSFHETSDSRGSTDKTRVLFKGNVAWKFDDTGLFYATISQGYRRGGSNGTPTTGFFAEDPAFLSYSPDRVTDYEAGIKGTFADGSIMYNADVFYVDWKDPQFNTATTNWGFFAVTNGEAAVTKGIELQLDGYSGNFHWGLGYTYTDAKLDANLVSADGLILINSNGGTLPGAPKHMLNGVVEYNVPFDNGTSLFLHVDGFYQSSALNTISSKSSSPNSVCLYLNGFANPCVPGPFYGQPRFYAKFPSFAIFNASATYTMERWSFTGFVKNIFNEEGITGEYTQAYMGSYPAQNYYGNASKDVLALPRTVGLTLKYQF